jgi:hypothetical protein
VILLRAAFLFHRQAVHLVAVPLERFPVASFLAVHLVAAHLVAKAFRATHRGEPCPVVTMVSPTHLHLALALEKKTLSLAKMKSLLSRSPTTCDFSASAVPPPPKDQ